MCTYIHIHIHARIFMDYGLAISVFFLLLRKQATGETPFDSLIISSDNYGVSTPNILKATTADR